MLGGALESDALRTPGLAGDGTRAARDRNNGERALVKAVSIDSVREPARHGVALGACRMYGAEATAFVLCMQ